MSVCLSVKGSIIERERKREREREREREKERELFYDLDQLM